MRKSTTEKGKERENPDGSGTKRNAASIRVGSIGFRVDKELVDETDRHCTLERSPEKATRHLSKYTPEERLALAKRYLEKHPSMTLDVYAALTGFSVYLEPAVYTLEYTVILENGRQIRKTRSLPVSAPQWPTETILLDERNTGIRTDQSEERRAQLDKLNAILFSAQEDAPRFTGPYQKPVDSERITSGFGDRREFVYTGGGSDISAHYGLDFGVPTGTPVRAAGSGRVVMAENRISTGWSVVLEHLPGLYSLYYHLDELLCAAGDTVTAGSIIGKSGATGLATGPHLHWEFRLNGEAVSPDFFLQDGFARLGADTFR